MCPVTAVHVVIGHDHAPDPDSEYKDEPQAERSVRNDPAHEVTDEDSDPLADLLVER